jgi:UDP-N-acetylglucosamine--N-acetylmuramyl-(pentapeptide) pyrophosphoryl-undecaprenol N-acetylglucosamine transferase
MASKTFRIVFAGGGSGGHVYPLIAVAEAIKKMWAGVESPLRMYYLGPQDGYRQAFEAQGIAVRPIAAGKLRRYFSVQNFLDVPKFFIGFLQALWILYWIMPDVVFSKGGGGALPVVAAAWWYRIPVAIHESDAKPGLNNLHSARFAQKIFLNFEAAAAYFDPKKVIVTGTPLRAELLASPMTAEAAKEALGFSSSHPLLFVCTGSQGSERINLFVVENLKAIMEVAQVFHQTGAAGFAEVQKLSQASLVAASYQNRYQAVSYVDAETLRLALSAADVVLARAGSSIFEFAAFGKPMILVPYPSEYSNDHQGANASAFQEAGAAAVIEEPNLFPGIFLAELKRILSDTKVRGDMSNASRAMFTPNAAETIATEILKLAA